MAVVPLVLATGGCRGCNEAGCGSSVTLIVVGGGLDGRSAAVEATMCLDDLCADWGRGLRDNQPRVEIDARGQDLTATMSLPFGESFAGDHQVSLDWAVQGEPAMHAQETIQMQPLKPNGEGCEPTCWEGRATVQADN